MLIQNSHSSLELPKASVAEGKLFSPPTAQPPCCSATLVFKSLVFAAVEVVQDTRRQLFSVFMERFFLPLTGLRKCSDWICRCLRRLHYGSFDSVWEAEIPSSKSYLREKKTNQTHLITTLHPPCHTFIFTTEKSKVKEQDPVKTLWH